MHALVVVYSVLSFFNPLFTKWHVDRDRRIFFFNLLAVTISWIEILNC
jgi:hypothetical protein